MKKYYIYLAVYLLAFTAVLTAQGRPNLALQISEDKINKTADEAAGKSDISYSPGDSIKYLIIAENNGDGVMSSPEVVDPIPAGVSYLAETAAGEDAVIQFSIDKGMTYSAWPPTYNVRDAQGRVVARPATADMVTHIKWLVNENLQPGDLKRLEFSVIVKN